MDRDLFSPTMYCFVLKADTHTRARAHTHTLISNSKTLLKTVILADLAWRVGVSGDAMGSVLSIGLLLWPAAWTLKQRWGRHLLAGPMVPQNPSQVRGGPKNTHQGGAGGWENLQVVCVCGRSKKQPFCDGSHFFKHTSLSPLKFEAQETCMVACCTFKATQKPPYCDGTHKNEQVQKAELGSPL